MPSTRRNNISNIIFVFTLAGARSVHDRLHPLCTDRCSLSSVLILAGTRWALMPAYTVRLMLRETKQKSWLYMKYNLNPLWLSENNENNNNKKITGKTIIKL